MILRPYQTECVESVLKEFEHQQSTLVVMATGLGKSVTIADLCRRTLPRRSICLAHRLELIHQLAGHLNRAGVQTEIEMAENKANHSMFSSESAVIASVQSMVSGIEEKRMEKFRPEDFGLVVIDECFVSGTLVNGIPIEKIAPGDTTRTSLGNGIIQSRFVKKAPHLLYRVRFSDQASFVCTENHPIHTTRGFIEAANLLVGDVAISSNGCSHDLIRFVSVEEIEILTYRTKEFNRVCPDGMVYNLEVSNGNTYFANGILVHNCHRSTAASYRSVINHFRKNPNLKIAGFTATADRSDQESLGQIFNTVAYNYDIELGIRNGWLCDIEQHVVHVRGLDYSNCRTTAGDLNGADLSKVMEDESNLQGMAGATLELIGTERKTIVFTASVRQAEQISNIFNRYHPGSSGWVCGATHEDDRKETIRNFRSGQLQILVNVGVCLEGFDVPETEVIVMGNPTKSRSRYTQAAGRCTRPLAGVVDGLGSAEERRAAIKASDKPIATILDFVGNAGRHKLISAVDALGGNFSEEAIALAKLKSNRGLTVRQSLEESEKEIERAKQEKREQQARQAEESQRIWRKRLEREESHKIRLKAFLEKRDREKRQEEALKLKLKAKVDYTTKRVNPFDAYDLAPAPDQPVDRSRHLSVKQKSMLLKMGVDPRTVSYTNGQKLIVEQFRRWKDGLCTAKQAATLKKFGYDTRDMKAKEASALITAIAANGWRRPVERRVAA